MKTDKNKWDKFAVEVLGWIFFISIPAGIWISVYRWQLIFTGLWSILMAIGITLSISEKEKNEGKNNYY